MSSTVLILGGNGLQGRYLQEEFRTLGDHVVATWHTVPPHGPAQVWERLDVDEPGAIGALVKRVRPRLIVNAAAMTNVDGCQRDPEASQRINVEAAKAVADAAESESARLLFYSTDSVFDGRHGDYREEDPVAPINVYGKHKLEAESYVRRKLPDSLVLRVSVVYGVHPVRRDFVSWLLGGWRNGEARRVVTDQVNTPTYARYAAQASVKLERLGAGGVLHVVGRGRLSRFEFAKTVARTFGFADALVVPAVSADLQQDAPRPPDASLNAERAAKLIGPAPTHEEQLRALRSEMSSARAVGPARAG